MVVNNFSIFVTGAGGGTLHSRINGSSTGAAITCNLSVGSAGLVQDFFRIRLALIHYNDFIFHIYQIYPAIYSCF